MISVSETTSYISACSYVTTVVSTVPRYHASRIFSASACCEASAEPAASAPASFGNCCAKAGDDVCNAASRRVPTSRFSVARAVSDCDRLMNASMGAAEGFAASALSASEPVRPAAVNASAPWSQRRRVMLDASPLAAKAVPSRDSP